MVFDYNYYNVSYSSFTSDFEFINLIIQNKLSLEESEDIGKFFINGIEYELKTDGHVITLLSSIGTDTELIGYGNKNEPMNTYNTFMKLYKLVKFNETLEDIVEKIKDGNSLDVISTSLREISKWRGDYDKRDSLSIDYKLNNICLDIHVRKGRDISVILTGGSEVKDVTFLHYEGETYFCGDEHYSIVDMENELQNIYQNIETLKSLRSLFNLK